MDGRVIPFYGNIKNTFGRFTQENLNASCCLKIISAIKNFFLNANKYLVDATRDNVCRAKPISNRFLTLDYFCHVFN